MAIETPSERVDSLSPDEQRDVLLRIVRAADAHGTETPTWLRSILHDYSLTPEVSTDAK